MNAPRLVIIGTAFTVLLAQQSFAAVINVDFKNFAEATHGGSNGVLSSGGVFWNGVDCLTDKPNLVDENAAPTAVGVEFTGFTGCDTDLSSTNELQNSGTVGNGFQIVNLVAGENYTLAVYGGQSMLFVFKDLSGLGPVACTGPNPTYILPGTLSLDYCLFLNRKPFNRGDGVFVLEISSLDGLITGFQLSGSVAPPPPPPPPPGCDLQPLIDTVLLLSLDQGIEKSLVKKLQNAIKKLEDGNPNNDGAACGLLSDFRDQVQAIAGVKISQPNADSLIDRANDLLACLSCP